MNTSKLSKVLLAFLLVAVWSPIRAEAPVEDGVKRSKIIERIWWNHAEKVEALSLSEEFRGELDDLLAGYLKGNRDLKRKQSEAMTALGNALSTGDDAAARKLGQSIGGNLSDPIVRQVDLMIAVLARFSPEQREILTEKYPGLYRRMWVRSPVAKMMSGRKLRTKAKAKTDTKTAGSS